MHWSAPVRAGTSAFVRKRKPASAMNKPADARGPGGKVAVLANAADFHRQLQQYREPG